MNPLATRAAALLAAIFRDEHEILFLLADAGFPSAEIPPVGGRPPGLYWQVVMAVVETSIIPEEELARRQVGSGVAAVLQQALRRRPANKQLRELFEEAREAVPAGSGAAAVVAAKILVLGAAPTGMSALRGNRELKAIKAAVAAPGAKVRFEVVDHMSTERHELLRVITAERPVVLHFSGHNDPRAGEADGALVLEGPDGGPVLLEADVLAQVLDHVAATGHPVQAVVLNACATETVARRLGGHADVIVCTRHALADTVAQGFAAGFYEGLAQGISVGLAIERGRVQALLGRTGDGARGLPASPWAGGGPDTQDVNNIVPWTDPPRDLTRLHVPARQPQG